MSVQRMPAAEVPVSVELVRRLVAEQRPDLAGLDVAVLANGWDNLVCRLGDRLLVRLPRRAMAAELVAHEQRWLPELAPRLPLPVPAPVFAGRPGHGYPWPWSIVPYLPGRVAADTPPVSSAAAVALGGFLAALHTPAPPDAPPHASRGIPLARRAEGVADLLARLDDPSRRVAAAGLWQAVLEVPGWLGPPQWLHGDLHPANLLVERGALSAVLDFGDLTSGDPAGDLSVAWMLFDADHRSVFRAAYGAADDHTWQRARGWALVLGLVFVTFSVDNPTMAGIGERTLDAVLG
ncbi:aminoglycoside phosphotransferase family protein [Actinocatenispora thailandica]|uniref:aminoglycoside phosphotransferase family protein n=1 Tax=Actinocatenispora thailandica TaxID=227318 RepID=UPI0019514C66|nr:aminoglycoside phosphotransferase family protein [Actinocatenispora thailandica]